MTSSATIDMRVDYLRHGKGRSFKCKSRIIRAGLRIVVSKTDLYNEIKSRIATGGNLFDWVNFDYNNLNWGFI